MLAANPAPHGDSLQAFGPARALLARVVLRQHLSRAEAAELFSYVLDEGATDAQVAAVLSALATKNETADELAGMAEAMRARCRRVACRHAVFVDTAGTGGSRAKSFNVSTAAAFVVAGAGVAVAKHGNGAASSRTGSADVLRSLGVNIAAPAEVMQRCLDELGICFLFAPLYHPACARAAAIRRQLGIPTAFNALGPLVNPAAAPCQLIGVPDARRGEVMAQALARLGTQRSWIVCGEGGEDEVSAAGATRVWEVAAGTVTAREVVPEDFAIARQFGPARRAHDPAESAAMLREVLGGKAGAERDVVVMNAAAALHIAGQAPSLREGARRAAASIDSGAAEGKLLELIRVTGGAA